jgi:hypothetical protein
MMSLLKNLHDGAGCDKLGLKSSGKGKQGRATPRRLCAVYIRKVALVITQKDMNLELR